MALYIAPSESYLCRFPPLQISCNLEHNFGRKCLSRSTGNMLAHSFHTLLQVHPSSVLETNEEGQLPDYVVYHELINTSRPFMRNVCAVEMPWVMPILKKIEKMDVNKLR